MVPHTVMVLILIIMTSSRVPSTDPMPHAVPSLHKQLVTHQILQYVIRPRCHGAHFTDEQTEAGGGRRQLSKVRRQVKGSSSYRVQSRQRLQGCCICHPLGSESCLPDCNLRQGCTFQPHCPRR